MVLVINPVGTSGKQNHILYTNFSLDMRIDMLFNCCFIGGMNGINKVHIVPL